MNTEKPPYKFISISCDEATIKRLDNIRTAFTETMGGRIPSRSKMVRELLKWMENALPKETIAAPSTTTMRVSSVTTTLTDHTTPTTPTDPPSIDYNAPFDGDNMPLVPPKEGITIPVESLKEDYTTQGLASLEGDWSKMEDFKGQIAPNTGDQPNDR